MSSKILVFGATSAIAQATARRFAAAGEALFLVARDEQKLEAVAADLRARGAEAVSVKAADLLDFEAHRPLLDEAAAAFGRIDMALIAHGALPDQPACQRSFDETRREFETNALSAISLATHLANHFEAQQGGTIAVISSVAGDRGRQSNYVYGAAKGAISIFLQGLRNRLFAAGVSVVTIKPGFVDTPMTADFRKGMLWAGPERVAKDIERAMRKGRAVVYTPWFWRPLMWFIRLIPENVFKRLKL